MMEAIREALEDCAGLFVLADGIQSFEDFEGGQPNLGTLRNLQAIKNASLKAQKAIAELEKPAETGTARLVAQSIIGMALADYSGLERQLENDTLISIEWIQQYAAAYHAEQCKACKALPEES